MSAGEIRPQKVQANGLTFNVASCGDGERLALCLHGFPELCYSWRFQLPLLARLGYRAWAPDLRGYGGTDRPPDLADYAIEKLLADVSGLIDASGARQVVLLGHDWGALIAWYYAMRPARPLERLVIMNVPHPQCFRENMGFRQLLRSWYALFFQLPWLPEKLLGARGAAAIGNAFRGSAVDKTRFPDEVLEVYREAARQPGAITAMLNYYRAILRGGGQRRQAALGNPRIEIPVLMVWGEQDVALGKELTHGTEKYAPHLVLRYLPGVSHWVQQEAPEKVNAMLEAFLLDHPVPEASDAAP